MSALVVTSLSITPIKGMRMHAPGEIVVGPNGAAGNRDFLLVDEEAKIISISKAGPLAQRSGSYDPASNRLSISSDEETLAGVVELGERLTVGWWLEMREVPVRLVVGPWNELLERFVGKPVRLVKTDEPGAAFDTHPVTLLGEASLRALERESGLKGIDPRRFRMLIQFASEEEHVEDTWKGAVLGIGSVRLQVGGPVARCTAITRDPERGCRDAPLVKAIKDYRGMCETDIGLGVPFGVYARVLQGGRIRVGDRLQLQAGVNGRAGVELEDRGDRGFARPF